MRVTIHTFGVQLLSYPLSSRSVALFIYKVQNHALQIRVNEMNSTAVKTQKGEG